MQALRGESADSSSVVAALTARWAQLMDIEVPQDLQQALQAQQAACEGVLGGKGAVIEGARNILKAQDDEYVATLSAQAEVGRGYFGCASLSNMPASPLRSTCLHRTKTRCWRAWPARRLRWTSSALQRRSTG